MPLLPAVGHGWDVRTVVTVRTFTDSERRQRDEWVTSRMEDDCAGCTATYDGEGYEAWKPAEMCPVHGRHANSWWADLNDELDTRWPGAWMTG
jgi:hypothetical protein